MSHFVRSIFLFSAILFQWSLTASAVDIHDTRLMQRPAVSSEHIAFVYAGDLWVSNHQGGDVRRLTSHLGFETFPRFSPDGRTIAFSGEYDGNVDVYTISVEGGSPIRLTWHPGFDIVQGFTIDGSAVAFVSPRSVHTGSHAQLFTIPVEGGYPSRQPLPFVFKAAYSPDGRKIAYVPNFEAFQQWKNYRGGTVSRILIYDSTNHAVEQIPQPQGRCNDTDPIFIGETIYFRSDRNGEFNLFSFDVNSKAIEQLTDHSDFPIIAASGGGGKIVYEQNGYLHLFNIDQKQSRRIKIGIAADLTEKRPRYVSGNRYIRNHSLSPSGARAAFEFRGEIVTVPAKKGNFRNLTQTTAVHERSPIWSPDGKSIAYLSDASGEYELHIAPQDGKGEIRKFTLKGAGFYDSPKWSPDGKKISFSDNSWTIYWLDLETGLTKKIASEYVYGPIKTQHHSWSPDSRWIVYTQNSESLFQKVNLYSLEEDRSYTITEGLSDVGEPVFDSDGKYVYMLASTDAGPVRHWFAMSNADMQMTQAIYLAVLGKGVRSPLAKESDEEEGVASDQEGKKDDAEEKTEETAEKNEKEDEKQVKIDLADLDFRIVALPVKPGSYSQLSAGDSGQLYYLKSPQGSSLFSGPSPDTKLYRFDLKKREEEEILSGVTDYQLSYDHKKILYFAGGSWGIADAAGKIDPGKGKIATESIEVRIDPAAEWRQIYDEAWRINRDYFYATNMHGADWPAMRQRYEQFLPHLAVRSDLNRVIQWLCSELAVGHHRVFGGDTLYQTKNVPGGLLGADFEIDKGRYRFAKIFGGLNWNPELRSPLTEPGVDAVAGDYLLAVDGVDLQPPENLFSRFENTVDKLVEITIGPNADGTNSRTVQVVPIANERALRNRDWVEGNIRKVDEATDGRVAYVYVPNTTSLGHTYFKRYFFPQAHKEAIIVDERYNGGGQVADYYIDILRRPFISNWAMRYGADLKTPSASIQGPKVMLIDENAGSGGDLLPWMFRKLKLGKLIGKRTWGGLVGVLGFPILLDGGGVTAPNLGIWTEDGWVVENVGVPPDIEVEQTPAEVIAGRDPQLEKAIEVILEELAANPPVKMTRPPFPVRVRKQK